LTPLDYFLWGTVKDECYANQPETIQELKHKIKVAIDEIRAHTVENVLKNWVDRMGYCATSRGCHLNEISCLMAMYYLSNKAIKFEKYSCVFF